MHILPQLASSLNRRDEVPNQELAKQIAGKNDKKAVAEVVENLHNKDKNIQSDCIKVLDEIAKLKPKLVVPYAHELVALLHHKTNRLQWGAMAALDSIASEVPEQIHQALAEIIDAADKGSVITNDRCVGILVKLCAIKKYAEDAFVLLNERILKSPVNQLPTYVENALPFINENNKALFLKTLTGRLSDLDQGTKRTRLEKVIKKLQK